MDGMRECPFQTASSRNYWDLIMKKAKLQKLLLQARETKSWNTAALKTLSGDLATSRSKFSHSKEALKKARKQHKDARKEFQRAEEAFKARRAEQKEVLETLACLEQKWRKLTKKEKTAAPKRKRPTKKGKGASIKVVPPDEPVAAT